MRQRQTNVCRSWGRSSYFSFNTNRNWLGLAECPSLKLKFSGEYLIVLLVFFIPVHSDCDSCRPCHEQDSTLPTVDVTVDSLALWHNRAESPLRKSYKCLNVKDNFISVLVLCIHSDIPGVHTGPCRRHQSWLEKWLLPVPSSLEWLMNSELCSCNIWAAVSPHLFPFKLPKGTMCIVNCSYPIHIISSLLRWHQNKIPMCTCIDSCHSLSTDMPWLQIIPIPL